MRIRIARALDPIFRSIIDRFDTSVRLEDHASFIDGLIRRGRVGVGIDPSVASRIAESASARLGIAKPHWTDVGDACAIAPFEDSLDFEAALAHHQLSLIGGGREVLPSVADPIDDPAIDWEAEPAAARRIARSVLQIVASAQSLDRQIIERMTPLLDGLGEHRWFLLKRGTIYGTADFLRSMLAILEASPDGIEKGRIATYCHEVVERLTRHLEVKREDALRFDSTSLPEDADQEVERVRFSLALIQASRVFDDRRFLNTALKSNDWHLERLRRTRGHSVELDTLVLHYMASLTAQETRMHELFG